MDGIQRAERSRERLGGPRKHRAGDLDHLHCLDKPKRSFPSHCDLVIAEPLGQPQTVQGAQAFHFEAGYPGFGVVLNFGAVKTIVISMVI